MTNRMLSALASLTILASACDGGSRSPTPTAPSPAPPSPERATYTLSGVVSEATPGLVPVEDVRVEDGRSRLHAMTAENGQYSISGVFAQSTLVSVSKWGYVTATTPVQINGDTQLDIQVTRAVSYTLSGLVFEVTASGPVAVEGVQVYCDSCGELGHTSAYTDASGLYSFSELLEGVLVGLSDSPPAGSGSRRGP
jgi:hypothetical protein